MKRLAMICAAVTLLVAGSSWAQEATPPGHVNVGVILQKGMGSAVGVQIGGAINVMQKKDLENNVTSQIYFKPSVFVADDVDTLGGTADLEALTGYLVGGINWYTFSVGIGVGTLAESPAEESLLRSAFLLEFGWRPIHYISADVGVQYFGIEGKSDRMFVYGGVGIAL